MCRDNEYGCHATATSGVVWTGVITDIGLATPTEEPVTRTPSLQEGIEAWGIKLISVSMKHLSPSLLFVCLSNMTKHAFTDDNHPGGP